MYDEELCNTVSQVFADVIVNEVLEPNSIEISRNRISQMSFGGDRELYKVSLTTSDGFETDATFSLQQLVGKQSEFDERFNYEVREICVYWDCTEEEVSISTSECCEDVITSQFHKDQFVSLFRFGFSHALANLKQSNAHVIEARTSWYGDEHPSEPDGFSFFASPPDEN